MLVLVAAGVMLHRRHDHCVEQHCVLSVSMLRVLVVRVVIRPPSVSFVRPTAYVSLAPMTTY